MSAIVTIDFAFPRVGTCRICHGDRTVYPVKDGDGAWSWACRPCAGNAEAMQ